MSSSVVLLLFAALFCVVVGGDECASVESASVWLWNGVEMPRVGLGTAGRTGARTVRLAYDAGVRLFDTARAEEWYDESGVARGLSDVVRSEVFVITKLHPRDHGSNSCARAVDESAAKFGGVIDLFLLHYPSCWEGLCGRGWRTEGTWRDSWRSLERAYEKGTVRAIGVSNFQASDFKELLAFASIKPQVIENYLDPFHQDRSLKTLAEANDVVYVSYSTLGTQWQMQGKANPVFSNAILENMAREKHTDIATVVLTWALAKGLVVIPRSTKADHLKTNANLLQGEKLRLCLTQQDLKTIDDLDNTHKKEVTTVAAFFSSDIYANLFWLDDQRQRHHVAHLKPNDPPVHISTYPGHTFHAVTHNNITQHFYVDKRPGEEAFFHLKGKKQDDENNDAEEEL